MKNILRFSIILMLLLFVISCACIKGKNTISGNVELVEYGKDGYTAKVKTANNEIYLATISRINLVDAQEYKVFQVGEKVTLKGEFWKTDTEKYIKVTDIISFK